MTCSIQPLLYSTNFQVEFMNNDHLDREKLNQEMVAACQNLDFNAVKELLKRGADYDQTIVINFNNWFTFISQIQDADYLYQCLISGIATIKNQVGLNLGANYLEKIESFLLEGNRFSKNFIPKSLELIQELAPVLLSPQLMQILIPQTEEPLIEAAFNLRDLELIQLLVAAGLDLSSIDLSEMALLDLDDFTKTAAEIVEYLIEQGIPLEQLLDEDETLLDLLAEAEETNNHLMVDLVKKYGIGEKSLKLNPNVIAC